MATAILSTANTFLPSTLSSSPSSAVSFFIDNTNISLFPKSKCQETTGFNSRSCDDEELLEKVKRDRKKRLERQGVISSAKKETGYLQELVYRLSKAGQAIESNDLPTASSVLGASTDTDWVQKANIALNKLSSSPEEKTEVDTFNSSLASLISSVTRNDIDSSKLAFVSSANAIEKWTSLTGLIDQLKGL
ncbi:thylakoid lumenal 16.5 kDa protein chloroplastic [Prunus yedoensis var. nudiflora]|uniref:Thylakoid lumenal 16.5 kDa protein chloroplastic n=1 Tax=Prunus yedoensis var. nudiflora TaxID=2094558 RepID=A0A314XWZ1_PRUYE|nr:thylakoid lumenal 16.5 kDa protein chloroplastic [Prunus yedoensis var. nudiflora]